MAQSTVGGTTPTPTDPNSGAQASVQKRGRTNPMDVRSEATMAILGEILDVLKDIQQFMVEYK